MKYLAMLFVLLTVQQVQAAEAIELVGPMAGPSAMREARIWLQGKRASNVQLEYWEQAQPAMHHKTAVQQLKADEDFAQTIVIENLEPGSTYQYQVLLGGKAALPAPLQFKTRPLWQWRTDAPDFKVALGSCAYVNETSYDRPGSSYGGGYEIFDAMAASRPDLTLWLGDNVYFREADFDSRSGMSSRYRHDRGLPELEKLLRTGEHAAIWDDHDYGMNDANSSFVFKAHARKLFKRYWPNTGDEDTALPGIQTVVSFNDADFFLLDDRWYRDNDRMQGVANKGLFGPAQLRWLQNALLASTSKFKIIASGGQLLNEHNKYEGWNNFPEERKQFLEWLEEANINGVLLLSGDRHHTELLRLERSPSYPLYELTCSPLTSGTHKVESERDKPELVPGTLVGERNFCVLSFEGKTDDRRLLIGSYSASGKLLWQQTLALKALSR